MAPELRLEELSDIAVPTLMMIGDRDMCTVELAEASDALPMEKPQLTAALVLDFLAS